MHSSWIPPRPESCFEVNFFFRRKERENLLKNVNATAMACKLKFNNLTMQIRWCRGKNVCSRMNFQWKCHQFDFHVRRTGIAAFLGQVRLEKFPRPLDASSKLIGDLFFALRDLKALRGGRNFKGGLGCQLHLPLIALKLKNSRAAKFAKQKQFSSSFRPPNWEERHLRDLINVAPFSEIDSLRSLPICLIAKEIGEQQMRRPLKSFSLAAGAFYSAFSSLLDRNTEVPSWSLFSVAMSDSRSSSLLEQAPKQSSCIMQHHGRSFSATRRSTESCLWFRAVEKWAESQR